MQAYEKALRMNPFPPSNWLYALGMCYLYTGQCDQAIAQCEKAVQLEPKSLLNRLVLTLAYATCGQEKDARSQAEKVLEIRPKFSVEYFGRRLSFKNAADKEFFLDGLRKAGLM